MKVETLEKVVEVLTEKLSLAEFRFTQAENEIDKLYTVQAKLYAEIAELKAKGAANG